MSHPTTKDTTTMSKHLIELTPAEHRVSKLVTELIGHEGMNITEATEHAITTLSRPRPEFVLLVSGGTLARIGDQNYRVADLEEANIP